MPRTRTFIAVDVSADIRAAAIALQDSLAKSAGDVNWAAPESMHVTLHFLGEVDDRELHAVCRVVKEVAATEPPFPLGVSGVGAFPTPRRPKILWAGITEGAVQLKRLYDKLEEKLLELGCYRQEERGYTPHLTLGRVKRDAESFALARELPKHLAWDGGRTVVNEVLVYSSVRERDGPVHSVIGRGELAGE
jgi:RNA 2',3'-cyclic 3'-phosphodiesterase